MVDETKFCQNCGETIDAKAVICPKCGVKTTPHFGEKNPGLAAVLSFLIVGLGQVYNGQIGKGLVLIIFYFVSIVLCFVLIGFVLVPILWIYGVYDAYNTANLINSGEFSVA